MSCRIKKDTGIVEYKLRNDQESQLFKSLKGATQDSAAAEELYQAIRSDKFKRWYGKDWEKDYALDLFITDENGEPKLITENGFHSIRNPEGKVWPIFIQIKEKSDGLNLGRDIQKDLIGTLVGFINNIRTEHPSIFKDPKEVDKYFGKEKNSKVKGDLADRILQEAFPGATIEQAKALYDILDNEGAEAMFNALPDNVTLNENGTDEYIAWEVFTGAYDKWNTITNPITGNIERTGVRELLKDSLSAYGMKLKDRLGAMEEFDDTPERIHNLSRLQENPRDKLSSEARFILGNIETGNLNSFGYPELLSMDEAYSLMAESSVSEATWSEMQSKLNWVSIYKPKAKALLNKIKELIPQEEAALFSNFNTAYNNFLLFKSDASVDEKTGKTVFENKMVNSNQSNSPKRALQKFRDNSNERNIPFERAIYKRNAAGEIEYVKKDKLKKLTELWNKISAIQTDKRGKWNEIINEEGAIIGSTDIDILGEYLWTLGMQYGPTLQTTQANLLRYYINGNEEGLNGADLFNEFVFESDNRFDKLLNALKLKTPKDIYSDQKSLIENKIASLSFLFDAQPFGSVISGTLKELWPINLPTRLHELTNQINNTKEAENTVKILNQFLTDDFFRPFGEKKYSSPLVTILHERDAQNVRNNFVHDVLDAYKSSDEFIATSDYDNQSSKIALIERFLAYNNRGNKEFTRIAIPTQAGRGSLDFIQILRTKYYTKYGVENSKTQLIENLIVQDLSRIYNAETLIDKASKEETPSILIEGYHYSSIAFPYAKDGSVFNMTQIYELGAYNEEARLEDGTKMSNHIKSYVLGADFAQRNEFENLLSKTITRVKEQLKTYEQNLDARIKMHEIQLMSEVSADLNTKASRAKFVEDYIFENFIGRIEITKMLRSGFSFAQGTEDFYKRMALLKTPGVKLFTQGMSEVDPEYGMAPTYNAITIRDFDFTNLEVANEVADRLETSLAPILGIEAKAVADNYRGIAFNKDFKKTDAQAFISLKMYRGIMQGMGQWDMILDEQAYNNVNSPNVIGNRLNLDNPHAGKFVDNEGNPRPIYPLKPYHEEISLVNGVNTLFMDKNSYTVVIPELADKFPYLGYILDAMNEGVDVVNTISSNKGAKKNVQDLQTTKQINWENPVVMDSSMLRFPQLMPRTKQDEITFNRQLRKNIIANINPDLTYNLGGNSVTGSVLSQIYGQSIAENIEEDRQVLKDTLGITALEKLKNKKGTKEYHDAKLKYLTLVRDKLVLQIKDRELPNNYLDALNIVPDGIFDWDFAIPLSFPNYQAKFEGVFMSPFNNELFNQKLKGKELVQIAELGGHETSGELKMYDGINMAQVRVKASVLGLPPGTRIEDVSNDRLELIGYRIPQQGKNSALVMDVVDFLPESYEKAIMVPGGITVQMGSDFDIDKLNIILRETLDITREGELVPRTIQPDYTKEPSEMTKKERNNVIYDTFKAILTSKHHIDEVIKPLDIKTLENLKSVLSTADISLDYNDPMSDIAMEERSKEGDKLIGLWANQLAGRNVSETIDILRLQANYMPTIDGKEYFKLGSKKDTLGNYTDSNISEHLSAAVDSAKNPIQLDINDSIYTNPVLGLFYSLGVPIETTLLFVNQPIIKEVIENASNNARSLGDFYKSINQIADKYKITDLKLASIVPMSSAQLTDNLKTENITLQKDYLTNFNKFFLAGRSLQTVNKIITPDNLDNVNEISSITAWIDRENMYLNNLSSPIQGAEDFIVHDNSTKRPLNPIGVAYRSIFDTMLEETSRIGFINNTSAFNSFKNKLKDSIGSSKLTAAQHKMIDRALFLKIMTQPHSPFVDEGLISKDNFTNMYLNTNNNLVTKLNSIRNNYPELNANLFLQALEQDPSNKETGLFLLRLNLPTGISTADKNEYSESLRNLIKYKSENKVKEKEVNDFGKLLVINQILNTGFNPTFGSYIDLIPPEVLTTSILNGPKESPVAFFKQEREALDKETYFDDFLHEFIRTYGLQQPGGTSTLKIIKVKMDDQGFVSFGESDTRIYGDNNYAVEYFLSYSTGEAAVFVNVEGRKYRKLELLGKSKKLNESGISAGNSKSLVNLASNTTSDTPGGIRNEQSIAPVTINEDSSVVRTLNNKDC